MNTLSNREHEKNQRIIRGFLERDDRIVYECYEDIYPMIHKYITANSGDENDARTLTMESLEAFYECCQKPDFKLTCKFSSFMYSICRNTWLKKLKRRKRYVSQSIIRDADDAGQQLELETSLTCDDYEETLFFEDLKRIILEFAAQVSPKCLEMIRLKFIEGHSHEEITELLNISIQNSRKRLYDCNKKLASQIANSQHFAELTEVYPLFEKYIDKHFKE